MGQLDAADTIARLEAEEKERAPPAESFRSRLVPYDLQADTYYVDLPKNNKRLLVYFFI